MRYDYDAIVEAYRALGVRRGQTVLLKADIRTLGPYAAARGETPAQAHIGALLELLGPDCGTLAVSTGSPSLCNTDTAFDPAATPSEMGVLSEQVRRLPGAVRSRHPFFSYAACGPAARALCADTSRHVYGPFTPKDRLIAANALFLSVGIHPRGVCSAVHQAELVMGVPYRYVKEYLHPVVAPDGRVERQPFYMHVRRLECQARNEGNHRIFAFYERRRALDTVPLGRGEAHAMPLGDYYEACLEALKSDLFLWLEHEPENKSYRI